MATVFVSGSFVIESTSETASFNSGSASYNGISFSASFLNKSATNTHSWYIIGTNAPSSSGTFTQGTITRTRNHTLGESVSGSILLEKRGPNGGLLGSAQARFTTGFSYDDTPSPPPPPPAPSFTDQTITTTWIKTRNFSDAPDRTVAANNTTSYAIKHSSSGLNPTSWLTINSSGELSGVPATTGVYTFVITATGSGGSLDSNLQTLTINPPGNRRNETNFDSDLIVAKRYDGAQWVNVSTFKRFDGTAWVDITN